MVNGGRVSNWTCINFVANMQENVTHRFCRELTEMCQVFGMKFALEPVIPPMFAWPEQVETALKAHHHDVMNILQKLHKELDLLVVILPDHNISICADLKRVWETELGLVSQYCLGSHVYKMSKQYLANVALEINAKVGGRNTVLVDAISRRRIPLVSDIPTIIFGADLTHPRPWDNSSPSIAAVVASQDWPEISKYAGLVCFQAHGQELIQDLFKIEQDPCHGNIPGGMIRELLMSFKKETGDMPQRIIFYRVGVSEGQFNQVLLYELDAIRKACASLEPGYQPPVTFVVIQRYRYNPKLFANNPHSDSDHSSIDNCGNVLPAGTDDDSIICHPTQFDFYLCSHVGIQVPLSWRGTSKTYFLLQGTSQLAHYHVLCDGNNFSADALQTLTINLCCTYATRTSSTSIVPPAIYANAAAFRARFYMDSETSDSSSKRSQFNMDPETSDRGSKRLQHAAHWKRFYKSSAC